MTFGNTGDFDKSDAFSLAVWLREGDRDPMTVFSKMTNGRGYAMRFDEAIPIGDLRRGAKLSFELTHGSAQDSIRVQTRRRLPTSSKDPGEAKPWYHVVLNYDGSGKASGVHMFINGKAEELDTLADGITGSIRASDDLRIAKYKGSMDDLRIYSRQLSPDEIAELAVKEPARATLLIPEKKRAKDQAARLRDYFLTYEAPQLYRTAWADFQKLKAEQYALDEAIPTSMVMAEMAKPRDSFVLGRGDYRNQGEKVTPGVPAVLPPLPAGATREPSHPGQVAGRSRASAHRARGGEPLLADVFRNRNREDHRRLRFAGRSAFASRAAGLAGH